MLGKNPLKNDIILSGVCMNEKPPAARYSFGTGVFIFPGCSVLVHCFVEIQRARKLEEAWALLQELVLHHGDEWAGYQTCPSAASLIQDRPHTSIISTTAGHAKVTSS